MAAVLDCASTTITIGSSNPDVFLNFRGVDTRNNFVGFLHLVMKIKGIDVFLDSEKLWTGEAIGPACLRAIGLSKISIPVFSQRYADSKWCLLELAQIHRYHIENGQLVLPIFFDVDPSHVRNQTGNFEEAFKEHEKNFEPQIVDSWRKALKAIGSLKGEFIDKNKNQAQIVELIVKRVSDVLVSNTYLAECKHPIGMSSRINDLLSLLSMGSQDVQFIGICGLCGIGKTTVAKAVYNCIHSQFDRQSFVSDINKVTERNGLTYLQQQVLKDIFKTDFDIFDHYRGKTMLERRLRNENVLLVLDGIDSKEQLDALAGEISWFGGGSRVLITTRYERILNVAKVDKDKIYWLKELNHEESLHLFSLHAFSMVEPPEEYIQLSHDMVSYSRGLPSTLEVLGCYLSDISSKEDWKITLRKLKTGKASIYQLASLRGRIKNTRTRSTVEDPICCHPLLQRTIVFNNPVTMVTQVFTRCLDSNGSTATNRITVTGSSQNLNGTRRLTTPKNQDKLAKFNIGGSLDPNGSKAANDRVVRQFTSRAKNQDESPNKPIRFTLKMMKAATKDFDASLKIGNGGFGTVYKGFLKQGSRWVAIKVADLPHSQSRQRREEFLNEITVLSNVRHRHLVSLIGFCEEKDEMILVYEYMVQGSLRQYLLHHNLTWKERLQICIDVARGLHYLHSGSPEMKVIHRDVKTDNILLDEKFMAKVGDFGISVISEGPNLISDNTHDFCTDDLKGWHPEEKIIHKLKGTPGYIDPEYVETGRFTDKSDVYSFGVVLLEVVCGQQPFYNRLLSTFSYHLTNGEFARVMLLPLRVDRCRTSRVDGWLIGKYSPESMELFEEIVEKCIRKEGQHRPTMEEVLSDLERVLKLHEDWLTSER